MSLNTNQTPSNVDSPPAGALQQLKIINVAMAMGVLMFLAVALLIQGAAFDDDPELITWGAMGIGALMVVAHLVLPGIITNTELQRLSDDVRELDADERVQQLSDVYRTRQILTFAMLEGAAMINIVAYIVEATPLTVATAAALLVLLLLRFPTSARMSFWIENRLRELQLP